MTTMNISYHGHSVVKVEVEGKTILIDPFLTGNSLTDLSAQTEQADAILLTHGHNDHVGDTVALAAKNNATVVAPVEAADYLSKQGVENAVPLGLGGTFDLGYAKLKYVQAFHSSSYTDDAGVVHYMGVAGGILLFVNGLTIYHAGDTALFGDLELIGRRHPIDVAFLPIGGHFTMDAEDAAYAVSLLKPKIVVPVHYDTFPPIKADPNHFAELVKDAKVQVLAPGGSVEI